MKKRYILTPREYRELGTSQAAVDAAQARAAAFSKSLDEASQRAEYFFAILTQCLSEAGFSSSTDFEALPKEIARLRVGSDAWQAHACREDVANVAENVRLCKERDDLQAQVHAMHTAMEVYARDTEAAMKEANTLRSGYAGYLNILSDICGALDLPVSYQFVNLPDAVRALKDSGRTDPTR